MWASDVCSEQVEVIFFWRLLRVKMPHLKTAGCNASPQYLLTVCTLGGCLQSAVGFLLVLGGLWCAWSVFQIHVDLSSFPLAAPVYVLQEFLVFSTWYLVVAHSCLWEHNPFLKFCRPLISLLGVFSLKTNFSFTVICDACFCFWWLLLNWYILYGSSLSLAG